MDVDYVARPASGANWFMASDSKVPKRPTQDSVDIDGGWDDNPAPPPSRLPVSPVRGGTFRFGEEPRGPSDARLPQGLGEPHLEAARGVLGKSYFSGSPVRGGTLSWDDLVAAAKRELPAKPRSAEDGGRVRSWEEMAAVARALGIEGVPDKPADELEAVAVDQLLTALDASPEPAPAERRREALSSPDIVIEGEIDLATALDSVEASAGPSEAKTKPVPSRKGKAGNDEA